MSEKILTFVFNKENECLEIHTNYLGIKELIEYLEYMLKIESPKLPEHIHLMSPSWGGEELTEDKEYIVDGKLIKHVKAYRWE